MTRVFILQPQHTRNVNKSCIHIFRHLLFNNMLSYENSIDTMNLGKD
jgi:hypothetical protein